MSVTYSTTPFTVTGQTDIEADAPRSQGMDDDAATKVIAANDALSEQVLHLHVDVTPPSREATVAVDNAPEGAELWLDFGDGDGVTLAPDAVSVTHTYLTDGTYTVAVYTRSGVPEMAQQQVAINWPPYPSE